MKRLIRKVSTVDLEKITVTRYTFIDQERKTIVSRCYVLGEEGKSYKIIYDEDRKKISNDSEIVKGWEEVIEGKSEEDDYCLDIIKDEISMNLFKQICGDMYDRVMNWVFAQV